MLVLFHANFFVQDILCVWIQTKYVLDVNRYHQFIEKVVRHLEEIFSASYYLSVTTIILQSQF